MIVKKSTYNKLMEEHLKLSDKHNELKDKILGKTQLNDNLSEIYEFKLPEVVLKRTKEELNVSDNELELIIIDFFDYMYAVKKYKNIDMISKTTDVLWHNFILYTEKYLDFCLNYVGFFVHHNPYIDDKFINKQEKNEILTKYKNSISSNYSDYRYTKIHSTNSGVDIDNYILLYGITYDTKTSSTSYSSCGSSCSSSCGSSCSSCSS